MTNWAKLVRVCAEGRRTGILTLVIRITIELSGWREGRGALHAGRVKRAAVKRGAQPVACGAETQSGISVHDCILPIGL
jgi:hypothetical protein